MSNALSALRGRVTAASYAFAWWLVRRMPESWGRWVFQQAAEVARRFFAFREGLGFEVLPATGGMQRFGVLAQRLRAGGLVCLPADRDVTGGGIEVDFFGEKAHMMGGAAALAVQTGAALMPVTLWFDGPLWGAHIHEEIPVPGEGTRREKIAAMTQQVARIFEAGIAEHPEDWHMLQRVFSADLDLARLAAAQATARAAEDAGGAAADAATAAQGPAEAAGGASAADRAALNGQAGGAALDGLADGAGASEGGSGP